jgi:membrane associated rhomboid family serine protease
MSSKQNIGKLVRKQRKSIRITLNQLSELSGVSVAHLSRVELGQRVPSPRTLQSIAKPLGFDLNELLILAGYISPEPSALSEEQRNRYRRYQRFSLNPIWIIIAINLLMLVTTIISPKLIYLLGLVPAIFLSRPWTIVTNLFIHGGLWHLLANMLTLYFFGRYLSRLIGDGKLLIVYFAGGILGNILYILLGEPLSVAVGASGSVFALGGVLTMMRPKLSVLVFPIPIPLPLWVAVIGGFLILSFLPFVAWQAHLGGLIIGLIAGYIFRRKEHYFF